MAGGLPTDGRPQPLSRLILGRPSVHRLRNVTRYGSAADSNRTLTWSDGPGEMRLIDQPSPGTAEMICAVDPVHWTVTELP
ncbi:hypothetical protein GCM10009557_30260 [Virgisporangium ochraceum]